MLKKTENKGKAGYIMQVNDCHISIERQLTKTTFGYVQAYTVAELE